MSSDDKPWACKSCTYINTPITLACVICGTLQDGTVGTSPSSRPLPIPAPAGTGARAKSPAKVAKTGTTPPTSSSVPPVAAAAAGGTPSIGFKLPIKARLDSTVRQFQLDRWIYSSLVETTQRLFNITHCSLFYGTTHHIRMMMMLILSMVNIIDDEPKGGAPNLVPIRNDIGNIISNRACFLGSFIHHCYC